MAIMFTVQSEFEAQLRAACANARIQPEVAAAQLLEVALRSPDAWGTVFGARHEPKPSAHQSGTHRAVGSAKVDPCQPDIQELVTHYLQLHHAEVGIGAPVLHGVTPTILREAVAVAVSQGAKVASIRRAVDVQLTCRRFDPRAHGRLDLDLRDIVRDMRSILAWDPQASAAWQAAKSKMMQRRVAA